MVPNKRQEIGQTILDVCSGFETETALLAQADAIATAIGGICYVSGNQLEEAEALGREMSEVIMRHIRDNWGGIETGKTQPGGQ